MGLAEEAAYLYVYAKKLRVLNNRLKRLGKKAEKHYKKHVQTTNPRRKLKHRQKHEDTVKVIKHILKKHNDVLATIKHHSAAFSHALYKEHKLR